MAREARLTVCPLADAQLPAKTQAAPVCCRPGYALIAGPDAAWLGLFQRARVFGEITGRALRVGVVLVQHSSPDDDKT